MHITAIASQKGGVGKTTTALNLACLAGQNQRTVIVDTDPILSVAASLNLDLSQASKNAMGLCFTNVCPGLDLLIPDRATLKNGLFGEWFKKLVNAGDYQQCIVDTQPFKGSSSRAILQSCDAVVTILRADAMTYRTLPPFLKELQAVCSDRTRFAGLLLTLPREVEVAEKWETALREQFGKVVLRPSIPHDDSVETSLLRCEPVVQAFPDSSLTNCYKQLLDEILPSRVQA